MFTIRYLAQPTGKYRYCLIRNELAFNPDQLQLKHSVTRVVCIIAGELCWLLLL